MKLWMKILIGLGAGVVLGTVLNQMQTDAPEAVNYGDYIKPVGDLFISGIKMLIAPLIFASLVVGVTSMKDPKQMGRVGIKTFALYLGTTAVAITIGLLLGTIIKPGAGLEGLEVERPPASEQRAEAPSVSETIVNIVPTNPIAALTDNSKVLQIIFFAIIFGISINMAGEKGRPVANFLEGMAEVMYKLTSLVMEFAPYGVFALMTWVASTYGLEILRPLVKVIFGVYLGCFLHAGITLAGMLLILGRLRPGPFFKGIFDAQAVAFSTASSSGTLPVTLRCAQENLGVSKTVSSFVLPLGATINMDGTAMYMGVAALFVSQFYGIPLEFSDYVMIIFTATLASIGSAGVPGAGLIMLTLVLTSVNLPVEGIAIVAGIDRILDMARTMINVTGDSMVSVLVAKSEGELDESIYNAGRKCSTLFQKSNDPPEPHALACATVGS